MWIDQLLERIKNFIYVPEHHADRCSYSIKTYSIFQKVYFLKVIRITNKYDKWEIGNKSVEVQRSIRKNGFELGAVTNEWLTKIKRLNSFTQVHGNELDILALS